MKSWGKKFKSFSFTFGDDQMSFDHSPTTQTKDVSAAEVLSLVEETFSPNEEFTRAQLEGIEGLHGISTATLKRRLNQLVETGKLIGSGENKNRQYSRAPTIEEKIAAIREGNDERNSPKINF